jgi:hypothetical protein
VHTSEIYAVQQWPEYHNFQTWLHLIADWFDSRIQQRQQVHYVSQKMGFKSVQDHNLQTCPHLIADWCDSCIRHQVHTLQILGCCNI